MKISLNKLQIEELLDIKDPFLIIDSIELDLDNKAGNGTQLLKKNDWFFNCHLSHSPVMPATLIIEGMLQTMATLIYKSLDHQNEKSFIVDIQSKILSSIKPNENHVNYSAKMISSKRGITKGIVEAFSSNIKKSEGIFVYASPSIMPTPTSNI